MRKALGTKENLFVTELDVTNEDQVNAAVRTAVHRFERIDVLVNNAGYGQLGVFEETTPVAGSRPVRHECVRSDRGDASGAADHAELADRSHLQHLCHRRTEGLFRGRHLQLQQIRGRGLLTVDCGGTRPVGNYVTAISPGFFRTDFLDGSSVQYAEGKISDYAKGAAEFRAFMHKPNHEQAGNPARLAKAIMKPADVEKPPASFVAGSDAVEIATDAISVQKAQIDSWRDLSVSTDGTWSQTPRQAG